MLYRTYRISGKLLFIYSPANITYFMMLHFYCGSKRESTIFDLPLSLSLALSLPACLFLSPQHTHTFSSPPPSSPSISPSPTHSFQTDLLLASPHYTEGRLICCLSTRRTHSHMSRLHRHKKTSHTGAAQPARRNCPPCQTTRMCETLKLRWEGLQGVDGNGEWVDPWEDELEDNTGIHLNKTQILLGYHSLNARGCWF